MKVCLCMMVRNESRVIERALDSVVAHVDAWFVADTGSTDDTPTRIERRMRRERLPGRLHRTSFVDFGTSRTETVTEARRFCLERDIGYLLLLDADEVVEVRDRDWKQRLVGAPGLVLYDDPNAYRIQVLVPTAVAWRYVGRTHEYIEPVGECPAPELFDGIVLHDHADGGCKADKYDRDLRLLSRTVVEDPADERAWFYLGETYLNGNIDDRKALEAYTRRATMGGFEEEAWFAAYRRGHCLERLADGDAEPWTAIVAYFQAWERRPWRAEPLFEVVRLAGERGMHALGAATGDAALERVLPRGERASDLLFVDRPKHGSALLDWTSVCLWWCGDAPRARELARRALRGSPASESARLRRNVERCQAAPPDAREGLRAVEEACRRLREEGLDDACVLVADAAERLFGRLGRPVPWRLDFERSICEWYVDGRRDDGRRRAFALLDRRGIPDRERDAVRANLEFYVEPLSAGMLRSRPIVPPEGALPAGYAVTNPSIAFDGDRGRLVLRAVNYRIREDGSYAFEGAIHTHNVIVDLDAGDEVARPRPLTPGDGVEEGDGLVRGFEDCRIVAAGPEDGSSPTWWAVANREHPGDPGLRAMFLLRLEIDETTTRIVEAIHLHGHEDRLHQKNWMPVVREGELLLVYTVDPTVVLRPDLATGRCEVVARSVPPFRGEELRGGSGLVEIGAGEGWLAFVHGVLAEGPPRRYYHRIVRFGPDLAVTGASPPFLLRSDRLEFVAGCARDGPDLVLTWGEDDARAWIGRMALADALALVGNGTGATASDEGTPDASDAVPLVGSTRTGRESARDASGSAVPQTLVTALFDLERRERIGRRPVEDYLEKIELVLDLGSPIVAYVDPELVGPVERIAGRLGLDRVRVVARALEDLPRHAALERVRALPPFANANPVKDTPLHQIVAWSKLDLVAETIAENPFGTDRFGWVDAGIGHVARPPDTVPGSTDEATLLQIHAVAPAEIEDREAFLRYERGRIAGGFIRGSSAALLALRARFDRELERALDAGIRPTEQAVLSLLAVETGGRPSRERTRRSFLRGWSAPPGNALRFNYGGYASILRNWDRVRGEATVALDNAAHCRLHGLWRRADAVCRAIGESVDDGALTLGAETRARWLDEWLVAAWNLGDLDRCGAVAGELRDGCGTTAYWARDRERLERNVGFATVGG